MKIILRWMLKNQIVRIGSGCNWLRFTLFSLVFRLAVGFLPNTLRTARAAVYIGKC
jgi:hypothetical protein